MIDSKEADGIYNIIFEGQRRIETNMSELLKRVEQLEEEIKRLIVLST